MSGRAVQRMIGKAVALTLLMTMLVQPGAEASQVDVDVLDFSFSPQVVKLRPGDAITWTNLGVQPHSATSNTPLNVWDSGILPSGISYTYVLPAAGSFLYHCTVHFDMTGLVAVVPTASPRQGQAGTLFTITVAIEDSPGAYLFDIQRKDPGGRFQPWITGATTMSVTWDSTGQAPGRYQFRARLRQVRNNVTSLWSNSTGVDVSP